MNQRPIENLSNSFGGSKVMSYTDFLVQEADLKKESRHLSNFQANPSRDATFLSY
jgi:hypothetical protein